MTQCASIGGVTVAALLAGAGLLHLLPRCGAPGRRLSEAFCHAPLVDVALFYFTAVPPIVGAAIGGWRGAMAGLGGQLAGMWLWIILHELSHPRARRGPRIYRTLDRIFGTWRNHLAMWLTILVVPLFWPIRLAQVVIYPWLSVLVHMPSYRQSQWISLSRQKFEGLVGYDLIWCLYCDWMTGLWSLASDMLRNVESFWCPIRFYDGKKCENCKVDFPDIEGGWVRADGTMAEVTEVLERQHGSGQGAWFGHPVRLSVRGREVPVGSGDAKPRE